MKTMPVLLLFAASLLAASRPAAAQRDPRGMSFEEWARQDAEQQQKYNEETTRAFQKFLEEDRKAFQSFLQTAGARWGKGNVWVPERKTWVQYTEDFEERSAVDFEKGTARVQVLADTDEPVAPEDLKLALEQAVQRVVLSGTTDPVDMMKKPGLKVPAYGSGGRRGLDQIDEFTSYQTRGGDTLWGMSRRYDVRRDALASLNRVEPEMKLNTGRNMLVPFVDAAAAARVAPSSPHPILTEQVRMPDGTVVGAGNADRFAAAVLAAQAPKVEVVTGEDGKKRQSATIEFPLVPEHIRVRAERFRPHVQKYSAKYKIHPPLVYAIMHTESAFNPRARSAVPAFGLMQLVPQSAGRDACMLVYGEDRLVTGDFLFDPERNVELGCAFLSILDKRYLKAVLDPSSRMYCSIAAYNTGAGNVSRAFGGGTSVSRAAPVINRLTPEEVYNRLRTDLPYEETRNYIVRVHDRLPMYTAWK